MATTRRKPLSRERILAAALELVDEQGIDALSMRKLGQSVGYEAMSLYNHVTNKDDLLDGMLDLVLAEMEPPAQDGGLPAIRAAALSAHEALQRHPWAAGLLMAPARVRPARLEFMDGLLGALRNAGFSPETGLVTEVGIAAADCLARAVLVGVLAAASVAGIPTYRDILPGAFG